MTKVVRAILGMGLLIAANSLFAATHPVPLDPKTPSEKCIECHEDKTKGKYVHSAIQTGCMAATKFGSTKT